MDVLDIIGRSEPLFMEDISTWGSHLNGVVERSSFLVIGGAGTIGQAVTREIFGRSPQKIHVVDISENNMVELVRDIRSTLGYISGDFRTFAIDCGTREFEVFLTDNGPYDYVLNLSALKHVRSEQDPYTLMRMMQVNIFNVIKMVELSRRLDTQKFFCVSTDKAANPVNMMGASKRIMELFLMSESAAMPISMSRFANVAFSDGSLLHGFNERLAKRQPIAAPNDVRRYFVTPEESGELCLMSCLLGDDRDVFFPKLSEALHLTTFPEIAERYLHQLGYEPFECTTEDEARARVEELLPQRKWPCYFFQSDTTGEKDFEEFFTDTEDIDIERFESIGIIRNKPTIDSEGLKEFTRGVEALRNQSVWSKGQILELFARCLPEFEHKETGKYLDQRM